MDPTSIITPHTTHPETAWLADLTPLAATIAAILIVTFLMQSRLGSALDAWLARRFAPSGADIVDPALRWRPPVIAATRLLAVCVIAALVILVILSQVGPLLVAVVLAGPATALLVWTLLWFEEQRYVARIDAALPAFVGRLEAKVRAGSGLQPAIEKVIADMPASPLKAEWSWFLERLGNRSPTDSLPQQRPCALRCALRRHRVAMPRFSAIWKLPLSNRMPRWCSGFALHTKRCRRLTAAPVCWRRNSPKCVTPVSPCS